MANIYTLSLFISGLDNDLLDLNTRLNEAAVAGISFCPDILIGKDIPAAGALRPHIIATVQSTEDTSTNLNIVTLGRSFYTAYPAVLSAAFPRLSIDVMETDQHTEPAFRSARFETGDLVWSYEFTGPFIQDSRSGDQRICALYENKPDAQNASSTFLGPQNLMDLPWRPVNDTSSLEIETEYSGHIILLTSEDNEKAIFEIHQDSLTHYENVQPSGAYKQKRVINKAGLKTIKRADPTLFAHEQKVMQRQRDISAAQVRYLEFGKSAPPFSSTR
jgi:hypothetical protein